MIAPNSAKPTMKPDGACHRERVVAEERQGQDRLGRTELHQHEERQQHEARDDQSDDLRRAPRPGRAAEAREQDDGAERSREQRGTEIVDRVAPLHGARMERGRDHAERHRADRQVDVEDPAPGEMVDEEAAEQRPDHRRDAEHAAEESLVLAALARRDDVADHGERGDDQAAGAQALQRAAGDQLRHVLGQAAQDRAGEEDQDRALQDRLAPVEVAELSVQGPGDGRAQQIRGDHPGQVVEAAQVSDDRRQRRRHDRLVERSQQQHEHERDEDESNTRLGCCFFRRHPRIIATT